MCCCVPIVSPTEKSPSRRATLDDLSPLALTKMAGQLDADVAFTVTDGGQNAKITAAGRRLKFGEAAIDKIDANASLNDVWRHPVIDGQIAVDRATVAGKCFRRCGCSRVAARAPAT